MLRGGATRSRWARSPKATSLPAAIVRLGGAGVNGAVLAAVCYNPVSQPRGVSMASELLIDAIAMYRKIGRPKHVEMAEALLGKV